MTSDPKQIRLYLSGERRLPAGAIPLAVGDAGGLVCHLPGGRWHLWLGGVLSSMPPETQRDVVAAVARQLGVTSAGLAERLGVSPRTVETWRSGRYPLTSKTAYRLAALLVETPPE